MAYTCSITITARDIWIVLSSLLLYPPALYGVYWLCNNITNARIMLVALLICYMLIHAIFLSTVVWEVDSATKIERLKFLTAIILFALSVAVLTCSIMEAVRIKNYNDNPDAPYGSIKRGETYNVTGTPFTCVLSDYCLLFTYEGVDCIVETLEINKYHIQGLNTKSIPYKCIYSVGNEEVNVGYITLFTISVICLFFTVVDIINFLPKCS